MSTIISSEHVHEAAAKMGVQMATDEVEDYQKLLTEANDVFEQLIAMPEYHLPVDAQRFPRKDIHLPSAGENKLGVAWAHTFSVGGADKNSTGLLAGKTLCLKDNICVASVPQVNGSDMVEPWIPQVDATVVTRILEAGGEIIGTATCENMSYSPMSDTSSTGIIHNPYAEGYSAGGSSSGVGALVGSPQNYVDMGVGADQGGSIRIPSAMSGCVGLKPTHGLVPYTGIVTSEAVMDHVGPICKNVMDVAVLLEVLAGRDGVDDRAVGAQRHGEIKYSSNLTSWYSRCLSQGPQVLSGMKIGILRESFESPYMFAEMKAKVLDSACRLRELGAEVSEISMPAHLTGRNIWMGIRRLGGCISLSGKASGRRQYCLTGFLEKMLPMTQEKWDRTPPAVKSTIINGNFALENYPTLYAKCLNLAIQLSREYDSQLQIYDVLLTPSLSRTAPKLKSRNAGVYEKSRAEAGISANTAQFNLTGHPAMTIPIGFLPDMGGDDPDVSLPVGMQFVGSLHGEEKILKVCYAYERMFDWKENGKAAAVADQDTTPRPIDPAASGQ
ncbi:Amidase [Phlyctema vagabunda]|uniref:Amidase n=1 Tax=Phlyctema vagabunda TaxID=108571 RepID=A0ABR4PSX3_9HELO